MTATAVRDPHIPIAPGSVEIGSRIINAPPASTDRSALPIAPETPPQLLRRCPAAPRRSWRSAVAAVCVRVWEAALGPPLTDQARMRRKIAEFGVAKHCSLITGL